MASRLLAKVGDLEIFEEDVDNVFKSLPPEIQGNYNGKEGKKRLLDEVVYQELFYIDALEQGLDKTPEYEKHMKEFAKGVLRTEVEAKEALNRIQAGEDFAKVAKELSNCPSKSKGGDLGFFGAGRMVPEFEKAAFALEKDQVSEPVMTQFGYHLILKTDEKEAKKPAFSVVKDTIRQSLSMQKQNEVFLAKVAEFEKKYGVQRF